LPAKRTGKKHGKGIVKPEEWFRGRCLRKPSRGWFRYSRIVKIALCIRTYVRQPVLKGRFRNCAMIVTISSRIGLPPQSHGYFHGAGGRSAYLRDGGVGDGDIQMRRNLVVLAAVVLLTGMAATDVLAAGHGGYGGGHMGGRFGEPLVGSAPMTSPIYNPSTPYTVTQSPEVPVSPASPGSVFH
jgi:hypothetical protein